MIFPQGYFHQENLKACNNFLRGSWTSMTGEDRKKEIFEEVWQYQTVRLRGCKCTQTRRLLFLTHLLNHENLNKPKI